MTSPIYKLGGINPALTQRQQDEAFQRADVNKDNTLSQQEFKQFKTSEDIELSDSARAALFQELDANQDDLLTSEEITTGKGASIEKLQETLQSLGSLEESEAALKNLLGGSSMLDFLNGEATASDVLGVENLNAESFTNTLVNRGEGLDTSVLASLLADDD